jgi:hypothetical protein
MYLVRVWLITPNIPAVIDEREFVFGTWKEIGLWLDHYGYNTDSYKLEVRFIEQ